MRKSAKSVPGAASSGKIRSSRVAKRDSPIRSKPLHVSPNIAASRGQPQRRAMDIIHSSTARCSAGWCWYGSSASQAKAKSHAGASIFRTAGHRRSYGVNCLCIPSIGLSCLEHWRPKAGTAPLGREASQSTAPWVESLGFPTAKKQNRQEASDGCRLWLSVRLEWAADFQP